MADHQWLGTQCQRCHCRVIGSDRSRFRRRRVRHTFNDGQVWHDGPPSPECKTFLDVIDEVNQRGGFFEDVDAALEGIADG